MTDFRKMASDLRRQHDAERARAAEEANAAAAESNAWVDQAITALDRDVRPILTRAVADLKAEGIHAEITEFFDVRNRAARVSPSIRFHTKGTPRKSDGHSPDFPGAFFTSDGTTLRIGYGENGFDREPKRTVASVRHPDVENAVDAAVAHIVQSHFSANDAWGIARGL